MEKNKTQGFPLLPAINVLVVTVILSAVGVISVLYDDRPTVSEIEKRELTPLPAFSVSSLLHGQYTKQLSAYFADTFPAREELVLLAGALKEHRGFRFNDVLLYEASEQASAIDTNLPLLPEESTIRRFCRFCLHWRRRRRTPSARRRRARPRPTIPNQKIRRPPQCPRQSMPACRCHSRLTRPAQ